MMANMVNNIVSLVGGLEHCFSVGYRWLMIAFNDG